ncbi:MAG: ABC transporter permease [Phycisphaerae bacterium]
MTATIARRLVLAVPTVFGAATLIFVIVRLTPGDPATLMLGERGTPDEIARINAANGWDQPLWVQYGRFVVNTFWHLDLGRAYTVSTNRVVDDLAVYLPATIELSVAAMLIASVAGIAIGTAAGVRRGSVIDMACMAGSTVGISIPVFFLGLALIILLPGMPSGGRVDVMFDTRGMSPFLLVSAVGLGIRTGEFALLADALVHLCLPAVVLATIPTAMVARMTRAAMIDALAGDYVRTARAKGVSPLGVVVRHALRNALIPVVTILGTQFGYLLAGAVLTETVFAWPGIGKYVVDAALRRDYNAIQGGTLVIAFMFIMVNLIVDLSYAVIDPRVRRGGAAA